ncbi:putative zinc-binding metallopeptidase [Chitinophaga horti]|uniref:Zinc-binding metallopeptidase n=1 Tax=Chitinophaga horti TaxID=2920382 RepID=A0ABY6IWK5_9BACT|nr:putative zinc-binding metallopeptidase [Chitinophaga horti]UYQ91760.1 putative zinc-binding metallopeptidase [Chitinophaga horti]
MNTKYLAILLLAFCSAFVACKEEDLSDADIPGLGRDTWADGPIDVWIRDSLTKNYNVAVKYKWDQAELDFGKNLVPPKEENIIPVLSTIRSVWLDTYIAEAGLPFVKRLVPKFFVLVGSASYNTDGTITLGTAEGGRRVLLYVINDFRVRGMTGYVPSDSFNVKEMFHTIEHEFGHILHQNILYTPDFKRISVGMYTSNWNNISDRQAQADGFISAYAMSSPDEDFVEMISLMLIEGRGGFNNLLASITTNGPNGTTPDQARAKLRQKEAIVVSYFKDTWSIDFYSLQARTRAAVERLIK